MNVEIGTVAAQFPEKEYWFQIFCIGSLQCTLTVRKWPGWTKMFKWNKIGKISITALKFSCQNFENDKPIF